MSGGAKYKKDTAGGSDFGISLTVSPPFAAGLTYRLRGLIIKQI